MTVWSTKRRFMYGGSVVLVFALIFSWIFFKAFYHAPTCSDGIKNGDENGVDCGGSCKHLCTSDTLTPVVLWSKVFNISGDVYSAVAYIENPNTNSKNPDVTYRFRIFGADNQILTIKEGQTNIPKGKKFAVFETGIVLKNAKPKSLDFQFLTFSPWEKDTQKEPEISLTYGTLTATSTVPRIDGTVSNNSITTIPELELTVFVSDSKENVVAASHTFIDNLMALSSQDFVFTWPKTFNLGVEACINPLDVILALDRSSNMKSDGANPPEPFDTLKSAVVNFIQNLNNSDHVSVISFGDDGRIESNLSSDKQSAVLATQNLSLSTTTIENTNIVSALSLAESQLLGSNSRDISKKVIILITNGVPNLPKDQNIVDYPITGARTIASNINSEGISIYTIGLGENINGGFLKSLVSDDSHYFFAPNKEALSPVYSNIVSRLCAKKPSSINVIYRQI